MNQFAEYAAAEFRRYAAMPGFDDRVAAVLARQKAGEDLSLQQIADALQIPLWLSELAMMCTVARMQGHVIAPDKTEVH